MNRNISQAANGLRERERERESWHLIPKTVPSQHDHSLKESHPRMGEPASNGREILRLKCVAENEGEKRKKMMIE